MANLKSITDVPELTELMGSEKLILNDSGNAKQVAVGALPGKATWLEGRFSGGSLTPQLYNLDGSETTIQQAYDAVVNGRVYINYVRDGSAQFVYIVTGYVTRLRNGTIIGIELMTNQERIPIGEVPAP